MTVPRLAAGSAEWRLTWGYEGRCKGQTGFHLALPSSGGYAFSDLHELHEALLIWADLFWRNYTVDTCTLSLSRLYIKGISTSMTESLFLDTPPGPDGYGGAAETAVHVRQLVQGARRSENGHFFLPPPPVAEIDFGAGLTTGYISHLSTGLVELFNGVNAISTGAFPNVHFAVIHRSSNRVPLDPPIYRLVDDWVISPKLSVQRRRLNAQVV